MFKVSELKAMRAAAAMRKITVLKRLAVAQAKHDDVKCDQLYQALSFENAIISTVTAKLSKVIVTGTLLR